MKSTILYLLLMVTILFSAVSLAQPECLEDHYTTYHTDLYEELKCDDMKYTFDASNLLYFKLFNKNFRTIHVLTALPEGEVTYKFNQEGVYYVHLKYRDGRESTRKVLVSDMDVDVAAEESK